MLYRIMQDKPEITTIPTKPKAYSYLRFSTPEQMRGDSFRRQTAMAQDYAARHGLDLDESLTFHDLGVSGYQGKNSDTGRLADFLEAVRSGLIAPGSILLVEGLDRISRLTPRHALRVLESIVDAGVPVVTLHDGRRYDVDALNGDPTSLLIAILTFMRANEESATKSRRLSAVWEAKRKTATEKPLTGRVPAWLRLDQRKGELVVIDDRADVVRRVFDLAKAGWGQHRIADTLNREGVPCFGTATMWHRSYVKKLLENPAVMGTLIPHRIEYQNGRKRRIPLEPVPGYYPAVVDADLFASLNPMEKARAAKDTVKAGVSNILSGLAKCPLCGSTMTRVHKGDRSKPKLVCTKAKAGAGCEYRSVAYEAIEGALIRYRADIVDDAPAPDTAEIELSLNTVEEEADQDRERARNIVEAIESGGASRALSEELRRIEARLDFLEAEEARLSSLLSEAYGPMLRKRLDELSGALEASPVDRGKVNAALRSLVDAVVVDYRKEAIVFAWKHGGQSEVLYGFPDE